jgi:shikimate dehydrogenase
VDSYLVGLVGTGIGPSLSPALHEREADRLGLRYLYRRLDLGELGLAPGETGDLLTAARLTGFDGLNVTHPCKQLVLPHLDELDPTAAALGAVNTIVFRDGTAIGHNTDTTGFAQAMRTGLPDVTLDRVVLLGAGGAGAACAHALAGTHLTVFDQDHTRATDLVRRLGARAEVGTSLACALADADGLVHATPTGMTARPGLPLPADLLDPRLWVADVVYRPLATALVETARARGCRVLDGGRMAVYQAADAFRLFTDRTPDADRMLRHFDTLEVSGCP